MRILLADAFVAEHLQALRDRGHDCVYEPELSADDLPDRMRDVDVLVVRSTEVAAGTVDAADRLGMIVRAGAGTNTIDKQAAADRGIYVCNVPGRNAIAVAELAIALMLALDRRIYDNVAELRAGRWDKERFARSRGLYGRKAGVVGLGDIGFAFAERAAGLGMEVHAIGKRRRAAERDRRAAAIGIRYVGDLETLAATCSVLSFHVPAAAGTRGLIGRDLLSHCRDGATIINTSRGEIVDEDALLEAIDAKNLRVGLDVYPDEPASGTAAFASRLAQHPQVYGTHHIGASTDQAQDAIAREVVRMIDAFEAGEVRHCVNLSDRTLGQAALAVRHFDEVGVLATVLSVLKNADLNVEQMDNRVFAGAHAACATIHVSGEVPDDLTAQLRAVDRVIGVTLRRHDGPTRQESFHG